MLSRVAQNLYWLARYVERAEDTARLIRVTTNLLLDLPKGTRGADWEPLVCITGGDALFAERFGKADEVSVVGFLTGDPDNPGSILSSLSWARENLRTTRDALPREAWEAVNEAFLYVRDRLADGVSPRGRDHFLQEIIRGCQRFDAILANSLSHTQARDFILLGRHLERADMTTRTLDVRSANLLPRQGEELTPFDGIQWMSVLKSMTAYQMYRQQVRTRVRGADVLRFLLQDRRFPRAVCHCLVQIAASLANLPRAEAALAGVEAVHRLVYHADTAALAETGLHEFIDELQIGLGRIHDAIAATYFTPQTSQAMG